MSSSATVLTQDLLHTANTRDIANFVECRDARWSDDEAVGALLVHAFTITYAKKLPQVMTNEERRVELHNVESRRRCGVVRVLELGYRIIGSYALIRPDTPEDQAWQPNSATLRCVVVHPEFHGLKFAQIMLQDAEKIARSWQVERICLHVQQGADGVARLYSSYGFRRDHSGDRESYGETIEAYMFDLTAKSDPYATWLR